MLFVPALELGHLTARLDLDVQLDVLGQPGNGEVRRADQRLRTHHVKLAMGDVRRGGLAEIRLLLC